MTVLVTQSTWVNSGSKLPTLVDEATLGGGELEWPQEVGDLRSTQHTNTFAGTEEKKRSA